jgi:hypothetical protein
MSSTRRRRGRLLGIAVAVVLVLVAIAAFVYPGFARPETTKKLGSSVSVSGKNIPGDTKARPAPSVHTPLQHVMPLGSMVNLTSSKGHQLKSPLTLHFALNQRAVSRTVIATSDDGHNWSYLTPTLSADGRTASVQTTHFSFWQVLQMGAEWVSEFGQEMKDSFTGGLSTEAKQPKCENEDAARDGYQLSRTFKKGTTEDKKVLLWCYGIEKVNGKSQHVLKVVNPYPYPLGVNFHGFTLAKQPAFTLELKSIPKLSTLLGDKDHVVLFQAEEATFTVSLAKGQDGGIDTSLPSAVGQSLYGLQVGLSTLSSVILKFGAGKKLTTTKTYEAMERALQFKECYNAVASHNMGKLLVECIKSVDWLVGPKAIVLAVVSSLGSLVNYFVGAVQGVFDSITHSSQYAIRIERLKDQEVTFRNMRIFVPGDWHVKRVSADMVGVATTCSPQSYWDTPCTSFWLVGGNKLGKGYKDGSITFDEGSPYYPGTGIEPCRGESTLQAPGKGDNLWRDDGHSQITSGLRAVGSHKASYHEWRIQCSHFTSSGTSGSQPVTSFTQSTWGLPTSGTLVVSDWNVPGLNKILADASWK